MKKEPENRKPKAEKPAENKPQHPTLDADATVSLAAALGRVSKCLLMCAPKFPEGSEGALAIETARRSLPVVHNILVGVRGKNGGKK